MKKIILFLVVLLLFSACNTAMSDSNSVFSELYGNKWIVEQKEVGNCMGGKKYLRISNVDNPTKLQLIEVGRYTFDKTNIGDTITWSITFNQ